MHGSCDCLIAVLRLGDCMQLNPDILLSLSGLMVSQPLLQSVGRGFESHRKCWDFSSLGIFVSLVSFVSLVDFVIFVSWSFWFILLVRSFWLIWLF